MSHDELDHKDKGFVKPCKIIHLNVIEQLRKKLFSNLMQLKRW